MITLEQWTAVNASIGLMLTVRDVILIAGGAFLLAKATWEIHETLEGAVHHADGYRRPSQSASATSSGRS